ncbi:hypothetical protein OH76DRAFT_1224788 [Lentinus brumalis]|uniref:Uncharacterized protein n=1 Tax=Lentinus brumalis TaxID=2498619 RepID=A0A371DLT4_9APHY|nr:hypothetical protein OH76DRAFT_1224788 [Polyporus brumalis]
MIRKPPGRALLPPIAYAGPKPPDSALQGGTPGTKRTFPSPVREARRAIATRPLTKLTSLHLCISIVPAAEHPDQNTHIVPVMSRCVRRRERSHQSDRDFCARLRLRPSARTVHRQTFTGSMLQDVVGRPTTTTKVEDDHASGTFNAPPPLV